MNSKFVHIDGTFLNLNNIQSLHLTADGKAIIVNYFSGNSPEIKYNDKIKCMKKWRELSDNILNLSPEKFLAIHKYFLVEFNTIEWIEYDGNVKIAMFYREDKVFIIDYKTKTMTRNMYWSLLKSLTGLDKPPNGNMPVAESRRRADFWINIKPTGIITGMPKGEILPSIEWIKQIDKKIERKNNL
ncbi:MAG: hypothetical protein AB9836_04930 [Aminipila sp.]